MMSINLETVKLGNTQNHLVFTGYVPALNNCYKYSFDYTGVELTTTAGLLNDQRERLREELLKDFGYAPFNITDAEIILGEYGKQYRIEQ